jgi:hypothetical protein
MVETVENKIEFLEEQNKLLLLKVAALEEGIKKKDANLMPVIKEIITWHVHGSNGKIYWEVPKEVKEAELEILKKKLEQEKSTGKKWGKSKWGPSKPRKTELKDNVEKVDDGELTIKLTPAGE